MFCNALEMFKTKMIKLPADAMKMMMRRDLMLQTDAYETSKSTTSIIDEISAIFFEYISY